MVSPRIFCSQQNNPGFYLILEQGLICNIFMDLHFERGQRETRDILVHKSNRAKYDKPNIVPCLTFGVCRKLITCPWLQKLT